jgi:hypothetical protein
MEVWFTIQKLFYMKDFIPYEEALALKELGFDEECLDGYNKYGKLWGMRFDNQSTVNDACSAPLFSQAFRFFREKYTLDIHIKGTYFRAFWVIGIAKENISQAKDGYPLVTNWEYIIPDVVDVLTYEEAELQCLRKLIKIVKQNELIQI